MDYESERRMDEWMGRLLQAGVMLAAAVVLIGGVVHFVRHPEFADYRTFHGEPAAYRTLGGILKDAGALHGRGLIQLGLLLLIATPVARVLYSVLAFGYRKDWKYMVITLIVLGLLCYSLFGGHG